MMDIYPLSYPRDKDNKPLPPDADKVLRWLDTATDIELQWYFNHFWGVGRTQ